MIKLFLNILLAVFFITVPAISQPLWKLHSNLHNARHYHSAVYIGNSQVLVMGGWINSRNVTDGTITKSCEIVNVRNNTVYFADSMRTPRAEFVTLLAKDSNVVVIGGITDSTGLTTPICEFYNRNTGKWLFLGSLNHARRQHAATFISDDEILVVGGLDDSGTSLKTAEIFNISTGNSRDVIDFPFPSHLLFAAVAGNGDILAGGGRNEGINGYREKTIYLHDPVNDSWTASTDLSDSVYKPEFLRLSNGNIIIIGGSIKEDPLKFSPQIMREENGKFVPVSALKIPRVWHNIAQWNTDSIITMSGYNASIKKLDNSCEWTNLKTGVTSTGPALNTERGFYCSVRLPNEGGSSRILAISGITNDNRNTPSVEILEQQRDVNIQVCNEISGVINFYTAVTAISSDSVNVVNAGAFKSGHQVMLIQMQGAEIDTGNSSSYGTIMNYNGAGLYELAIVDSVSGNTVSFTKPLVNIYNVNGKTQLVLVPSYDNVTISGQLSAAAWDGNTGGILAFSASCITMAADIDVSGKGFRGGDYTVEPSAPTANETEFISSSNFFGNKGEGIAGFGVAPNFRAKGNPANGGGGGNNHNGGGGGGANIGAGGKGGYGYTILSNAVLAAGLGGQKLDVTPLRVFLGGGGGSGQVNNGHGSGGANGGGIVFIRANSIENMGSYRINASGASAAHDRDPFLPDGTGGGGAGGSVLLDLKNVKNEIQVLANGGNGGSRLASETGHGTGGGGGAGMIQIFGSQENPLLKCHQNGGNAGTALEGGNYGAEAGKSAITMITPKPVGTVKVLFSQTCTPCYPLIITATQLCHPLSFTVKDLTSPIQSISLDNNQSSNVAIAVLNDPPASEITVKANLVDNRKEGIIYARAVDQLGHEVIYKTRIYPQPRPVISDYNSYLTASGNEQDQYQWFLNGTPIHGAVNKVHKAKLTGSYTVTATSTQGCSATSALYQVSAVSVQDFTEPSVFSIYPNPAKTGFYIESPSDTSPIKIELRNLLGIIVWQQLSPGPSGRYFVPVEALGSGIYILLIQIDNQKFSYKIIKE